jgi:RNA 3'-terminal phosphate cyclase (ATP)
MSDLLRIDGSQGEGGGQILRTALALSLVTGQPFRLERIRAGRPKPGLLRQHLTAVEAAARVCGAVASGAELGSEAITFTPGAVRGGALQCSIGTAGSATLVLQAILPALLLAREPSRVVLEGGTHNPYAPPFEFLDATLLPLLRCMGARVEARLERHGFYPAGGGRLVVDVAPVDRLTPLVLLDRGPVQVSARALVSGVPVGVANRELAAVHTQLDVPWTSLEPVEVSTSPGPGNVLLITIASDAVCEVITGFGEKHVAAAAVAARACGEARAYLDAGVPVGQHLADQLLVPLVLAGGGSFRTLAPTRHTTTNAAVIGEFTGASVSMNAHDDGTCTVTVSSEHVTRA